MRWHKALPRVTPFYAVKCNDSKAVVKTLAVLGAGFDCASKVRSQLSSDLWRWCLFSLTSHVCVKLSITEWCCFCSSDYINHLSRNIFYKCNLFFLQTEIQLVQSIGVPPERIIYANPCKQVSQIKHAASSGVQMMTFDSEVELMKVARAHPKAK